MTSCDIGLRRRALYEVLVASVTLVLVFAPVVPPVVADTTQQAAEADREIVSQEATVIPTETDSVVDTGGHSVHTDSDLEGIYDDITNEGFLIGPSGHSLRHKGHISVTEREIRDGKRLETSQGHRKGRIEFGGHEVTLKEKTKPQLRSIPEEKFQQEIQDAQTYHDVIRLFYTNHAQDLTNGQLTRLYISQVVDNNHQPRNPIGLSRPLRHPSSHDNKRTDADTITEDDLGDLMMGDSPCPQCHSIPASASFWAATAEHRKRHKRKEEADNSGIATKTQGSEFPRRYLERVHKKTKRAMKKATEHITQMQDQWECREPTPVLVHMKDLQRSANRAYYPECTIIHKCQKSSGCCSNGEICGVKSAVNVTLHFWAPIMSHSNVSIGISNAVETFTFENHTECACQRVPTIPHCAPCPRPFIQYYKDQTECRCGCLDDDKKCRKIKRGRSYFEQDVMECLKSGECAYPNCAYGEFNETYITKGRCPHRKEKKSSHNSQGHTQHKHRNLRVNDEPKKSVSGKKEEGLSSEESVGLGSGANEQLDVR